MRPRDSWTAGLIVFGLGLGCGTSGATGAPVCEPCPECSQPEAAIAAELPPEEVEDELEEEPTFLVAAGACDTSWLPPAMVVDVDDDAARELVEMVTGWMAGTHGPAIDHHRGIVFAKSEDDSGADGPYPSFVGRSAERACGSHAVWLREHARLLVDVHASPTMGDGITCSENVCCYAAGGEFDSSGTLVFTRAGDPPSWALDAVAVVADNGTLGPEWVAEERAWVTAALRRTTRGRCSGEPNVVW